MSTYDRIASLCKEKGISVTGLEAELGFGRGSLGKMKKGGSTSVARLQKIASAEKKISRLKELYLNELITLDDYKHDLAAYKADIDTFKAEARKYKGTDKKALYDLVGRNVADWYWTLSEDERRVIWRSVIDQIYFDNDKNIKIVFR